MQEKRRQYSAGLKLKRIAEREAGKTCVQIAAARNVHYTTVMKWRRQAQQGSAAASSRWDGKDKILKERYYGGEQEIAVALEDAMPRKANADDLKNEIKALKEELSYYRHAAAWYKALNEALLGDASEDKEASKKTLQGNSEGEGSG